MATISKMFKFKTVKSYRFKVFLNFIILFILYVGILFAFQYNREKVCKREALESQLITYVDIFKETNLVDTTYLKEILQIIPHKDIRLTLIGLDGSVFYDNTIVDYNSLENHIKRPEIVKVLEGERSLSKRYSDSKNKYYYYYAEVYNNYIIRCSLPFSLSLKESLRVNPIYIVLFLLVFVLLFLTILFFLRHFGKSITTLQNFTTAVASNENFNKEEYSFPDNELGEVGYQVTKLYSDLILTKQKLSLEKEKLYNYFVSSVKGIAIFNKDKKSEFVNPNFIRYVNLITNNPVKDVSTIFIKEEFNQLTNFIVKNIDKEYLLKKLPKCEFEITKNGYYFEISSTIFEDKSFEVSILDVTKITKRKKLKNELSSNITHELKTPVAVMRGYLETIINTPTIDEDKKLYFLTKAFNQTIRLSDLINDLSLVTKLEEAPDLIRKEKVNLSNVLIDIKTDLQLELKANSITLNINIGKDTFINGNVNLLNSIFRNLIENSIKYAGDKIKIDINCYHEDTNMLFFSYKDNGYGISEVHLQRIFERFYRVDYGRTRKKGGTGIGLSIVKNAVTFHGGNISAKSDNGLEFIFTLKKELI